MNRKCKTISDVVGMTNTQVINNLLFIANNLIDFEEERFEDDVDDDEYLFEPPVEKLYIFIQLLE
jgi:hypothetical protein